MLEGTGVQPERKVGPVAVGEERPLVTGHNKHNGGQRLRSTSCPREGPLEGYAEQSQASSDLVPPTRAVSPQCMT